MKKKFITITAGSKGIKCKLLQTEKKFWNFHTRANILSGLCCNRIFIESSWWKTRDHVIHTDREWQKVACPLTSSCEKWHTATALFPLHDIIRTQAMHSGWWHLIAPNHQQRQQHGWCTVQSGICVPTVKVKGLVKLMLYCHFYGWYCVCTTGCIVSIAWAYTSYIHVCSFFC